MANNKDVKRGIVLYLDGKAVEANAQNIQREMRKVKKEIDGCTFGSKEYVEATKRYRELNGILQEHKAKLREVKTEHFSFINTVNSLWQKWNVTIGAFLAAFTGVSLALSKFRKEMNAEEDASANLKALTGLDDSSISWLQEQAEQLSTTMDQTGLRIQKSAKEILEAYMLVGSAKPELLQNKEQLNAVTIEALRLAESAKMEMKPAVEAVTLSLNQYGEQADQASRYVNVLAAGSKFGAAGVESQTSAIVKAGVAASTAKVPIESLVGSIETLAEKGIKDEVAGTGLKTFFLKLEGMADDVRPSVVGLETALENLRKKNLSTAETQKMFGLEAFTVAKAMIDGADKVREYTAAVTDTNTAIEQAAINSDTANAKLAQARNEFTRQGIILVQELNPAITKMINLGMNSTRMLVNVVRFLTQYRTTLALTTAAIALYVTWINRKIIADRLADFWTDKLSKSFKNLYTVIRSNPWGIALVAITAVTAAIIDHNRKLANQEERLSRLAKLEKDAKQQASEQTATVKYLTSVINDNNASLDRRRKALDKLKEIVPEYHAELDAEGRLIRNNTSALDDYLSKLETKIKMDAYENAMVDAIKRREKALSDLAKSTERTTGEIRTNVEGTTSPGSWLDSLLGLSSKGDNEMNKKADAARRYANALDDIAEVTKQMASLDAQLSALGTPGSGTGSGDGGGGGSGSGGGSTTNKVVDRIKQETAAINLEYQKRQTIIKQQYAQGIIDRQKYNSELEKLELERINRLLQIAGLEPEKVAELQAKIQDIAIKARESFESLDIKTYKDGSYEDYVKRTEELQNKQKQQLAVLKQNLQLKNITSKQYEDEARRIDEQYFNESTALWSEYYSKLNEIVVESTTELTETQKKQAQIFSDTIKPIMESLGNVLGDALAGALSGKKDDVHDAMLGLLQEIISAVQKMAVAYIAERTIVNVGKLGPWGLAKAAGEIALITAATATLNGLIERGKNSNKDKYGYATGGYTGNGGAFEPAGVVHRNEFVANRFAVANPAVRSVLDVIDRAQRSGSVANLTADDLRSVSVSSAQNSQSDLSDATLRAVVSVVADCTEMLAAVKSRFDKPIVSETYVTGKHGTRSSDDLYDKMITNASRT